MVRLHHPQEGHHHGQQASIIIIMVLVEGNKGGWNGTMWTVCRA
jgi:hypothetical protein